MKLPSLWPVACFAGGILLFGKFAAHLHLPFRFVLAAAASLLFAGFVALRRSWILASGILAVAAWMFLGFSAAGLERLSVPSNLASSLIESGKLDSSVALRWRGRLRGDPLQLPWGTRYEIDLDEVESSAGAFPVSGGLRTTSYSDESNAATPLPVRAGDRVEVLARAVPIRNFGNPGSFDYRGYLARQGIVLQATLRKDELLTILGHPRMTISERLARVRGRLLNSINELLASRPEQAALARAMLLGDRSFVERDRVVEYQKTGVYHVLVLAGLHVGALTVFFIWAGRRLHLSLLSRTLLTIVVLAAYVGIVEDRPPILRAALMAAIYLSARLLYRRMDLLNVAALSALVILVARPSEISDASFLLSFSAVGIIGALAVPWIAHSSEPYLHGLAHLVDVSRDVSSVSRIADQRLAGPEQQHQQNTQHAHDGENRLVQDHLDDTGPEPGRITLHPGPERLLAGLVNIVPELTKLGEAQGLVGDPAGPVIDHEDKSAGQQQKPHQSEKTADHASPYISGARKRRQALPGRLGKFNLISTL
ncbi:MAG: ComEC family competence protein [Acidobacteriia bacterium]|nr:ComEC family competence protein [Terriglobia bacterium]